MLDSAGTGGAGKEWGWGEGYRLLNWEWERGGGGQRAEGELREVSPSVRVRGEDRWLPGWLVGGVLESGCRGWGNG